MNEAFVEKLVTLLLAALSHPETRASKVSEFQEAVWNSDEEAGNDAVCEVLSDLAYDLDYYEPDPVIRSEDPAYYGDDRLVKEIVRALHRLKEAGAKVPDTSS